eukprot:2572584-Amphidinium_carterae.1
MKCVTESGVPMFFRGVGVKESSKQMCYGKPAANGEASLYVSSKSSTLEFIARFFSIWNGHQTLAAEQQST